MESVLHFLDLLQLPQAAFLALSPYVSLSIMGVLVAAMLGVAGFVLARMGYRPLWALVLIVPFGVIGLWVVAQRAFPREKLNLPADRVLN